MTDDLLMIALVMVIVAAAVIVGVVHVILRDGLRRRGSEMPAADDGDAPQVDVAQSAVASPREWRSPDQPERVYDVYEPDQLVSAGHLRGRDPIDRFVAGLHSAVGDVAHLPLSQPRRPPSILLHGPPGGAMTIMGHLLARRLRARLVQVCASRTLPTTNGGSQPLVAIAVNEARLRRPSVLMIDELEQVAGADERDAVRLRAANDLLNESLRPFYGSSHLVVGLFTTDDDRPPPPRLSAAFEHVLRVDVPETERALLMTALHTVDGDLIRATSRSLPRERSELPCRA